MKNIQLLFLISIFLTEIIAEKTAVTSDGKNVILLNNGTWRYATTSEQELFKNKNLNTTINTREESNPSIHPETKSQFSLIDLVKSDTSFDFRTVRWGMNSDQVLKAEKSKPIKTANQQIHYELQFLGYICQMIYHFQNNRLIKAEVKIKQDHIDPARYFKDYEDLKEYLQPIYGAPVSDRNEWKNDMYKADQSKWGFAVSIGFLSCRTTWQNTRSLVSLNISGGNHQITTILEYSESR